MDLEKLMKQVGTEKTRKSEEMTYYMQDGEDIS